MGLLWALMSVALVSAAQLTLRTAMTTLPSADEPWLLLLHLLHVGDGTLALLLGLSGYVASMACWFFALKRLPLAKAYALLSLSYMVVWLAAIWLPGWHEPFSWRGLLGVVVIVAGVITIFWPNKPSSSA
ncbi:TPA: 4-amino-4-deoxy-L-arabinose-phosphoundecaprenol flippase subunit ArnF [Kluyvera cryocrescens]|uniref:4-amino-4-deoxy-L-arabinose-phosphoundecaprenol flippase subunit ArnF n=1 Tax=Kluyvera cryocrescens TaxID=580 RepID=UPI000D963032|nr:4-amino-4-deoxy-L-arabinose-phosphoundecaprenol flippase subunit ArnF [Kluyvera cryocrescens]MCX2868607.1 4-amino-4-deoxy-L-arabinose-phosphoundecaprenol flippase subunit ArnF [Kluyvera cryocrescens]MEB6634433.1 4-amino-4-deoxy-L-arabinose-phosphoundecaprenol flippase subunit ArnF [Kluyvera cryocrescens]WNN72065.1 4-amino-4-deoxy-L-arabinose-phosphoundecaprenol flippase subunit ArnF [Kluyvera cryocrescens]SQC33836.1 Undecaprenyl phosphate-aminoarabinose flippase subunit ArnF [Kluyvera cryocr